VLKFQRWRKKMIEVGSAVIVSPNSGAFKGKKGIVIKILENSLLPYVVKVEGVDIAMLFSEDDLIEV